MRTRTADEQQIEHDDRQVVREVAVHVAGALVGEEEKTALSTALKRRQEADRKPVKTYTVPEVNRPPFSRDKRNAGADVAGRPKVRL